MYSVNDILHSDMYTNMYRVNLSTCWNTYVEISIKYEAHNMLCELQVHTSFTRIYSDYNYCCHIDEMFTTF